MARNVEENRARERLASRSYSVASDALRELVELPPEARDRWVPLLLDHLRRFRNNSEWYWIVECLPPHFARHRERIEQAFRDGLKSDYAFAPLSVLDCLRQLGPAAAALVPDVLAYVGRQGAFTNQEPHLIHLDPEGKVAIPGLVRLLGSRKETARYQAASELEAYGPRAEPAVPSLTRITTSKTGRQPRFDVDAAQRALDAIRRGPSVSVDPAWLTPTVRSLAQAAFDEPVPRSGELDPARLSVLADAAEEAGCTSTELISHLRDPGPHFAGCWAVELLRRRQKRPAGR